MPNPNKVVEYLPVFVYGTLRTGQGNWSRLLRGRTRHEIEAKLPRHKMYSVGIAYVTDNAPQEAESEIVGDLMYIEPEIYSQVMRNLDGLEGYNAATHTGHYLRVKRTATYKTELGQTREVEAWVYHGGEEALRRMTERVRVQSGDWLEWRKDSWR